MTKVLEIAFPGCLEMIKNATMVDSLRVLLHHDGKTLVAHNIEFNSDVNLDIGARSMVSQLLQPLIYGLNCVQSIEFDEKFKKKLHRGSES